MLYTRSALAVPLNANSTNTRNNGQNNQLRESNSHESLTESPRNGADISDPEISPTAAVRRNGIAYAWHLVTHLFVVNRPIIYVYLIWSIAQLATTILILFITNLDYCDRPLRIFLVLQMIRIVIAVPLFLFVQRLRRNSMQGFEFFSPDWVLRINSLMDFYTLIIFVVGNYMIFTSEVCSATAPGIFYLSIAFLVIGYITLMLPVIFCGATFLCLPCTLMLLHWIGVGNEPGAGATQDEIDNLSVLYYQPWTNDTIVDMKGYPRIEEEKIESNTQKTPSLSMPVTVMAINQSNDTPATAVHKMENSNDDCILTIPTDEVNAVTNKMENEEVSLGGWLSPNKQQLTDPLVTATLNKASSSHSLKSTSSTLSRCRRGGKLRWWRIRRKHLGGSIRSLFSWRSINRQNSKRNDDREETLSPSAHSNYRHQHNQPADLEMMPLRNKKSIQAKDRIDAEHALCAICLSDYELNDPIRRLRCDHHFHRDCVDPWFRVNRHCPVCKRVLTWKKRESRLSLATARWRRRLSTRTQRRRLSQASQPPISPTSLTTL
ncbi:hypothetical protein BDF19DRAFT_443067 [Syncephalis fuscata]|nr:hypothetical protein BDF19DRAFT_443067 [Syncephalis fuscata]